MTIQGENALADQSREYRKEIGRRMRTIRDDILDMDVDVQTELIKVSTAEYDFNTFRLSDLKECLRRMKQEGAVVNWIQTNVDALREGDVVRNIRKSKIKLARITSSYEYTPEIALQLELPNGKHQLVNLRPFEIVDVLESFGESSLWSSVDNVDDIADALLSTRDSVILVGGPGTGKTWFMQQLCSRILSKTEGREDEDGILPLLIPVQKLVRTIREQCWTRNLLLSFLKAEYPGHETALMAKLRSNQVILLIDGVDEAAGMRDVIESFVVDKWKKQGCKLVVTSRPEGLHLPLYFSNFKILQLLPLSPQQQCNVIERFLKKSNFVSSLFKLSRVRMGHDNVYDTHFDRDQKVFLQSLSHRDRFKKANGSWDEGMRQRAITGSDLATTSSIVSTYLCSLQEEFNMTNILSKLELELTNLKVKGWWELHQLESDRIVGKMLETGTGENANLHNVCARLSLLWFNNASESITLQGLWSDIAARSDELYVAAEKFYPSFKQFLSSLETNLDQFGVEVDIGPIKDPVRLYEKAQNDYSNRFDDALPEACVVDVLRARIVCDSAVAMMEVLDILLKKEDGNTHNNGNPQVVRLKNMFHPEGLTPTHFRFAILTLLFVDHSAQFLVEVQLHHREIKRFEDTADGHKTYQYFRSILKEEYGTSLSQEAQRIERSLSRFESFARVPVLLSLLVLIFLRERSRDPLYALELTKYKLYENAMSLIVRQAVEDEEKAQSVLKMLLLISTENMRKQRRIFDIGDVREALQPNEKLLSTWISLHAGTAGVPLVKTLTESFELRSGALYQFKHLSFSEALYFKHLTMPGNLIGSQELAKLMNDPFYGNVIKFRPDAFLNSQAIQNYIPMEGVHFLQLLKDAINSNPDHFESVLGVFVGKESSPCVTHAEGPGDHDYVYGDVLKRGTTVTYRIADGRGILLSMVRGDLQEVKDFVVKYGNLHVEVDSQTNSSGLRFVRSVDGFVFHRAQMGYDYRSSERHWDGISAPTKAESMLELAVESVKLQVARAIQDGMKERGEKSSISTHRFLYLLQRGVEQHAFVRLTHDLK